MNQSLKKFVSRRSLLGGIAALSAAQVLAACQQQPQIVEKIVEKPVEKIVEREKIVDKVVTQIVEKEKIVEKSVDKVITQIVEKEKVVVATAAPQVKAQVELGLMSLKGVGWDKGNAALIEDFTKRTGAKIKFTEVQWPIKAALLPTVAAGNPPDVVHEFGAPAIDLYVNDTFLTLNDLWKDTSKYKQADFLPQDVATFVWGGKTKAVPLFHNPTTGRYSLYRGDFYDEAGVPRPKRNGAWANYAEFYPSLRKLVKRDASGNVTRWGWSNLLAWSGYRVLGGILDTGHHWWNKEKSEFDLANPKVVNVIQTILLDPVFQYGVSPDESKKPKQSWDTGLFEGVYAAQHVEWVLTIARDKKLDDMLKVLDIAELPGMAPGKHNVAYHGTWGSHIVTSAKGDREAAFQLAMAQVEPPVAWSIMNTIGTPSALKAYGDLKEFKDYGKAHIIGQFYYENWVEDAKGQEFFGWEWGTPDLGNYPDSFCSPLQFVTKAEVDARCGTFGGSTLLSGKVTAEQFVQVWQDMATASRKNFFSKTVKA